MKDGDGDGKRVTTGKGREKRDGPRTVLLVLVSSGLARVLAINSAGRLLLATRLLFARQPCCGWVCVCVVVSVFREGTGRAAVGGAASIKR